MIRKRGAWQERKKKRLAALPGNLDWLQRLRFLPEMSLKVKLNSNLQPHLFFSCDRTSKLWRLLLLKNEEKSISEVTRITTINCTNFVHAEAVKLLFRIPTQMPIKFSKLDVQSYSFLLPSSLTGRASWQIEFKKKYHGRHVELP